MGRNISRAASLIDGFNAMYDTIGRVQRDRDMRQAATAMPTMDEGFTPEQGADLQAAANSGKYDVQYDEASKAYKVIPKSDPSQVGTIAPGQRQTFMGQVQNKPMDEAGISRARQAAMAGVLDKHGDIEGAARIRDRMSAEEDRTFNRERARTTAAREDQRFAWEKQGKDQEQAYREGLSATIDTTVFGQRSKAFQAAQSKYEADMGEYRKKVEAGDASAMPPPQPPMPTMTSSEKLLDAAKMVAYKAQHGKAAPEEIMKVSEQMAALGQEGYKRFLDMAHSGAPLTAVVEAFNAQGKVQIDPSSIVEDKKVKRAGGIESRLITYKLPDGRTQTIDTAAGLAELGETDKLLKLAKQEHDQRNQDRQAAVQERQVGVSEGNLGVSRAAEGRHQAEFRAGASGREAKAAEAKLNAEMLDPATTPARRHEIRGILDQAAAAKPGGAANEPADVKLARVAMGAGMFTDMKDALAWAVRNKDSSPDKVKADLYAKALTALGSPAAAKKATEEGMAYLYPNGAAGGGAAPAAGGSMSFASEAEATAAAAAGKIKPGDRITIGGRAGTWR